MGRIYEAIRRWQRAHGGETPWPAELSVLQTEGFLEDPRAWSCPVADQTGNYRFAPDEPHVISFPEANRHSNYQYELGTSLVDSGQLGELPDLTTRDAKMALMRTDLRGWVPVVRCRAHGTVSLNIGADGRRYRSGLYWEEQFNELRPEPYTMPWMVAHHPGSAGDTHLPRAAALSDRHVDLGPAANANPDLPWIDGVPQGSSLLHFVTATEAGARLAPLPFDARRLVQVTGRPVGWNAYMAGDGFATAAYPSQSRPIPLSGARGSAMHLLQATAFRGRPGEHVGDLVITLRGGTDLVVPLRYRENTDWWRSETPAPQLRPAWSGTAFHSPSLFRSEIPQPQRLAQSLKHAPSGDLRLLRDHLSEPTRSELLRWDDTSALPSALRDRLLDDLNAAFAGPLAASPPERRETFRAKLDRLTPELAALDPRSSGPAHLYMVSVELPAQARTEGLDSLRLRANTNSTASPFLLGLTLNPVP
ncbi:MAG: hypothetical protein IT580_20590 [Verrucomicrobiales bacterium]|nr:hypothetical protein [Verrucomicrobiales bacterium]